MRSDKTPKGPAGYTSILGHSGGSGPYRRLTRPLYTDHDPSSRRRTQPPHGLSIVHLGSRSAHMLLLCVCDVLLQIKVANGSIAALLSCILSDCRTVGPSVGLSDLSVGLSDRI